jgi:hypothetical protein
VVEDSIGGGSFLEFQKGFGKPGLSPTVAAFRLPKGAWGCPEEPWAHYGGGEGGFPKNDFRIGKSKKAHIAVAQLTLPHALQGN